MLLKLATCSYQVGVNCTYSVLCEQYSSPGSYPASYPGSFLWRKEPGNVGKGWAIYFLNVIIHVVSIGNSLFWGNYYAIPRSLTSSCRYYQCLLRCLVTNYSKLFVLVMTNKRAGHSLYTRLRNLLSIKSVERSEQQVQPSLNKLAIPSAVLAICPNLSVVLTVQGSSCCLLSTPLDGHASAWFCSAIWLEPPNPGTWSKEFEPPNVTRLFPPALR